MGHDPCLGGYADINRSNGILFGAAAGACIARGREAYVGRGDDPTDCFFAEYVEAPQPEL